MTHCTTRRPATLCPACGAKRLANGGDPVCPGCTGFMPTGLERWAKLMRQLQAFAGAIRRAENDGIISDSVECDVLTHLDGIRDELLAAMPEGGD
jgi:hypothetical protein